jgi:hypothetical protein
MRRFEWFLLIAVGAGGPATACSGDGTFPQLTDPEAEAASAVASGWSVPVRIDAVSTEGDERQVTISQDNLSLYVATVRNGNVGGFGSGPDIWVSRRETTASPWRKLENLGSVINTVGTEGAPNFSQDGHWMYFCSNGQGGYGGFDIFRSYRSDVNDDFAWGPPENLGGTINTDLNECDPFLFEDPNGGGQTLYFSVFGSPDGMGDWDIFTSEFRNGQWNASRLEADLDTPDRDTRMTLRQDGLEIVFSSNREGSVGSIDLWRATRSRIGQRWSAPENLGQLINSIADDRGPSMSTDGQMLYFSSNRVGARQGDVYLATRLTRK